MGHAAISVLVFGIYMFFQGLALLLAPNLLLGLFQLPEAQEVWVRVVGIALIVFSLYYSMMARANNTAFFGVTVYGRALQFALFLLIVFAFQASPLLLLFSGVELASGLWTAIALRGQTR